MSQPAVAPKRSSPKRPSAITTMLQAPPPAVTQPLFSRRDPMDAPPPQIWSRKSTIPSPPSTSVAPAPGHHHARKSIAPAMPFAGSSDVAPTPRPDWPYGHEAVRHWTCVPSKREKRNKRDTRLGPHDFRPNLSLEFGFDNRGTKHDIGAMPEYLRQPGSPPASQPRLPQGSRVVPQRTSRKHGSDGPAQMAAASVAEQRSSRSMQAESL